MSGEENLKSFRRRYRQWRDFEANITNDPFPPLPLLVLVWELVSPSSPPRPCLGVGFLLLPRGVDTTVIVAMKTKTHAHPVNSTAICHIIFPSVRDTRD